jgi:hypothetical protein
MISVLTKERLELAKSQIFQQGGSGPRKTSRIWFVPSHPIARAILPGKSFRSTAGLCYDSDAWRRFACVL